MKRKVGIIGCGHILARHIEAINTNEKDFELVALCDRNEEALNQAVKDNPAAKGFVDYKEMFDKMKGKINFVVIATPSHLHYGMAIDSLNAGYDILIEKPIGFESSKLQKIQDLADKLKREAYCVFQVRYNPVVRMLEEVVKKELLGDIRCVSFIQRWQRPIGYFSAWRGNIDEGGRTLYEYSIHYLDIIQKFFGVPKVKSTCTFNHKHLDIPFEDTLYSIVEYKNGVSGTIEVNIAAEPSNLECSISIMGSKGFLKIGGNAIDKIERASFETESLEKKWVKIQEKNEKSQSSDGKYTGASPNHPTLYYEIARGRGFKVEESIPAIEFIKNIYLKEKK
ncbi:MAG TPA: Gfo/Idh/MocA family oxidoreductase [Candidatus Dojkabacteria bacterium]|nr:Gfo/Idh/MocA family oxidoreductase [Methanofastidiosum sp.]HRZ84714.1 Gfo/Idh/MocA family oxidoreductase [Candidatus Dojkabacteria bacterium]